MKTCCWTSSAARGRRACAPGSRTSRPRRPRRRSASASGSPARSRAARRRSARSGGGGARSPPAAGAEAGVRSVSASTGISSITYGYETTIGCGAIRLNRSGARPRRTGMSTLMRILRAGGRRRPRGARRRRARRRRHGQARRRLDHPRTRRRHGQGPEGPRRLGHADHAGQGRIQGRVLPDHRRHHRPGDRGRHDHPQRRPAAARRRDPRAAHELHHRRRPDAVALRQGRQGAPARLHALAGQGEGQRAPAWARPSRASPSSSAPRARPRSTRRSASRPSRAGCASGPPRSRPPRRRSPSPAERPRSRSIPAPRRRWPRWASAPPRPRRRPRAPTAASPSPSPAARSTPSRWRAASPTAAGSR